MTEITKRDYYQIYALLHDDREDYEDRRERRVITNKFLAERNKADLSELTKEEADILKTWLESVC